jgi:hypothetical protein
LKQPPGIFAVQGLEIGPRRIRDRVESPLMLFDLLKSLFDSPKSLFNLNHRVSR